MFEKVALLLGVSQASLAFVPGGRLTDRTPFVSNVKALHPAFLPPQYRNNARFSDCMIPSVHRINLEDAGDCDEEERFFQDPSSTSIKGGDLKNKTVIPSFKQIKNAMADTLRKANFEPVTEEVTEHDIHVTGTIPRELNGLYVRNGPNLEAGKKRHFFLGRGMLHGIWLEQGIAKKYVNSYVETGSSCITDGLSNVSLLYFDKKLFSLGEVGPARQIDLSDLSTIGNYDFGGRLKSNVGAHPKIDSKGDLFGIGNDFLKKPALKYFHIEPSGNFENLSTIDTCSPRMVHDFAITEKYALFLDLPVEFDLRLATINTLRELIGLDHDMPFTWNEGGISRIGVKAKSDMSGPTQWFDVPICFIFHTVNAYEDEGNIIFDAVRYDRYFEKNGDDFSQVGHLTRYKLNLESGLAVTEQLDNNAIEFPCINPNYTGKPYRYAYSLTVCARQSTGLIKYDQLSQTHTAIQFAPHQKPSEFIFVPAQKSSSEDSGYFMGYVYDEQKETSALWIFDAATFDPEPLAVIDVGRRIPNGFHGTWVPSESHKKASLLEQSPSESTSKDLSSKRTLNKPMTPLSEWPTPLSVLVNSLPMEIKEKINEPALAGFRERNPSFDQDCARVKAHLASLGENTLYSLAPVLDLPRYYKDIVHIGADGINNGPISAIQVVGAHKGLYKHNAEVRSTTYQPAFELAQKIIEQKGRCRIGVVASGFGGDALDFIRLAQQANPEALKAMELDLFDLSTSFLDTGSGEIPFQLAEMGLTSGTYQRFSSVEPKECGLGSQLPNQHHIGYTNPDPDALIQNLYLKDISGPNLIENLQDNQVEGYDIVLCMYLFHEMPESKIRAAMENLARLGDNTTIFFQDMDFDEKMHRYSQQGLQGGVSSVGFSLLFAATEPYIYSPRSTKMPKLLAEFGSVTSLEQSNVTKAEASIQALRIDPNDELRYDSLSTSGSVF